GGDNDPEPPCRTLAHAFSQYQSVELFVLRGTLTFSNVTVPSRPLALRNIVISGLTTSETVVDCQGSGLPAISFVANEGGSVLFVPYCNRPDCQFRCSLLHAAAHHVPQLSQGSADSRCRTHVVESAI